MSSSTKQLRDDQQASLLIALVLVRVDQEIRGRSHVQSAVACERPDEASRKTRLATAQVPTAQQSQLESIGEAASTAAIDGYPLRNSTSPARQWPATRAPSASMASCELMRSDAEPSPHSGRWLLVAVTTDAQLCSPRDRMRRPWPRSSAWRSPPIIFHATDRSQKRDKAPILTLTRLHAYVSL